MTLLGRWEEPCKFVAINLGFRCTSVWWLMILHLCYKQSIRQTKKFSSKNGLEEVRYLTDITRDHYNLLIYGNWYYRKTFPGIIFPEHYHAVKEIREIAGDDVVLFKSSRVNKLLAIDHHIKQQVIKVN